MAGERPLNRYSHEQSERQTMNQPVPPTTETAITKTRAASVFDERELDVASLIALWLAIHSGDPAPSEIVVDDKTAALIAAALDSQLANIVESAPREGRTARLEERLRSFRIEMVPNDGKSCYTYTVKVPILGTHPERFTTMTVTVCLHVI
jgi:hypothetical protein